MTELDMEMSQTETYSRRSRKGKRHREEAQPINQTFQEGLLPTKIWPALMWSLVASILSVANPLLTGLADNAQSQSLYAGFAMQHGQSPYGDFFATNGVLYYLLTALGSLFQTTIGLAILQFIALSIAGVYFYKLVAYFSKREAVADQLTIWFYLFILAFGFGGVYASLFVLPFLLTSLWFLVRYFDNAVRDEAFVLYGVDAALVFMMYPRGALLWLVAGGVLLVYNLKKHQFARGVYQFLATIFGFLLVIYSVGYYTFIEQILGDAINQTFLYNFRLTFTGQEMAWAALFVFLGLLAAGFWKNAWETLSSFKEHQSTYMKSILLVTFLVQLVFIICNHAFGWHQLLVLLPYGFLMAVVHEQGASRSDYLKGNFFLPALVCVYLPLQPIISYFQDGQIGKERVEVAQYIQEHAVEDAKIFTWDSNSRIYLKTKRLSSSIFIAAQPYLDTQDNQERIAYDLNRNNADYIVINQSIPILDSMKNNLDRHYVVVETGTKHLVLYQKK